MGRNFFIFMMMLAACPLARAVELSRTLKTIDFEERPLGNDESLPMHWSKVEGPGLPHYVNGQLATDRAHGGQYSFRFDLNGGGLIYRYAPGLIKVQLGAHYRVEGYCQTTVLSNARARITAYFVDRDGRLVPKSLHRSALYAAASDDEGWKKLTVSLSADSPAADSLVIELELLQPAQYRATTLGHQALFDQDIHGNVWWDDISVSQVPAVAMRTNQPGNIFARGQPVRLSMFVSDRSVDDLVMRLSVVDATDREVYQRTGRPDLSEAGPAGESQRRMVVELPPLAPGWYEVRLQMSSMGHPLESRQTSLIVLPDNGAPGRIDQRFGMVATHLPFGAWADLPKILPLMSAGRVKLAVWSAGEDVEASHAVEFDKLLTRLGNLGIAPTVCLLAPPPDLQDRLNGAGWAGLLKLKTQDWQPDLAFLVARHANHVSRWQLGADDSDAFVTNPAARQVYKNVYAEFSKLIDNPDLAMPWPAWYDLSGELPATVALDVPPSILPAQLPLYLEDIRGRTDHVISLTLQPLKRNRYGRDVQIRDLAQRVIYALAAGAQRIDLPLPMEAVSDDQGVSIEPSELLMIMRTMMTTLSGAAYKGRVSLAPGVESFLFDRGGRGIIVLWGREDSPQAKDLALNLGDRPVSVNLWGDAVPLLKPRGENRDRVTLKVGLTPIFLVDIDGQQAQMRASVAIDRPLLESSFRPHERRIRFANSYDKAISGTLHLTGPAGWTLNPPTFNFNLNPGETFDQPVTIQFPYNSFAGAKTLVCDFLLSGQSNSSFSVPLTLKLGLSDVGAQSTALRQGPDIFVQQEITNYGDRPISYTAFAMYPNQARQERLVLNLAPGATTIRRYRFINVPPDQTGRVRVGLKELQGNRILNDSIDVR